MATHQERRAGEVSHLRPVGLSIGIADHSKTPAEGGCRKGLTGQAPGLKKAAEVFECAAETGPPLGSQGTALEPHVVPAGHARSARPLPLRAGAG